MEMGNGTGIVYYPLSILHFPLNGHDFFILVSQHIFNLLDVLVVDFLQLFFPPFLSSSASPSFTDFFKASMASRRALRTLTLAVSPSPYTV